jgi:hypothetical protein
MAIAINAQNLVKPQARFVNDGQVYIISNEARIFA